MGIAKRAEMLSRWSDGVHYRFLGHAITNHKWVIGRVVQRSIVTPPACTDRRPPFVDALKSNLFVDRWGHG